MTKARINRAIRNLDMEIQGNRRDGYFYWTSTAPEGKRIGEVHGDQVGESEMICYLHHRTLSQWAAAADLARREHIKAMQDFHWVTTGYDHVTGIAINWENPPQEKAENLPH